MADNPVDDNTAGDRPEPTYQPIDQGSQFAALLRMRAANDLVVPLLANLAEAKQPGEYALAARELVHVADSVDRPAFAALVAGARGWANQAWMQLLEHQDAAEEAAASAERLHREGPSHREEANRMRDEAAMIDRRALMLTEESRYAAGVEVLDALLRTIDGIGAIGDRPEPGASDGQLATRLLGLIDSQVRNRSRLVDGWTLTGWLAERRSAGTRPGWVPESAGEAVAALNRVACYDAVLAAGAGLGIDVDGAAVAAVPAEGPDRAETRSRYGEAYRALIGDPAHDGRSDEVQVAAQVVTGLLEARNRASFRVDNARHHLLEMGRKGVAKATAGLAATLGAMGTGIKIMMFSGFSPGARGLVEAVASAGLLGVSFVSAWGFYGKKSATTVMSPLLSKRYATAQQRAHDRVEKATAQFLAGSALTGITRKERRAARRELATRSRPHAAESRSRSRA